MRIDHDGHPSNESLPKKKEETLFFHLSLATLHNGLKIIAESK
jgi:hypothetical protein